MNLWVFIWLAMVGEPKQTTPPTTGEARMAAYQQRLAMERASVLDELAFRSVGPRSMGGRAVDLVGFPDKPNIYFAAYASGGVWRSENAGTTWTPIFDRSASITVGDIAVDPNDLKRIWVGTGEDNASRSSYAGTGIYFSADGGETWANKGLHDSHHISEIVLDPRDTNTLWVAVLGPLYSTGGERGVFKTTDGGKTWRKTLFIDERTGVVDLVMDPANPDRLYAAAWERSRTAWNFVESGKGSGIFISEDGGETWQPSNQGLPLGEHAGRIGLAVCRDKPNVVYASLDNQMENPNPDPEYRSLTKRKLGEMDAETFLAFEDEVIDEFLRDNNFHREITAESLREGFESEEVTVQDLVDYLYDGNVALFDVSLIGVEVYRSDDFGKTWSRTHRETIDEFAWSYGYYFGQIRCHPTDPDTLYLMGVPFIKSTDGGKTFKPAMTDNVHADHQALWVNPANPEHLFLGNDGGLNMSWDGGTTWVTMNRQPVGQFYTVAYDMAFPYRIYGGLQDNGVWVGGNGEQTPFSEPWERLIGGDGAFVQVDPRDNQTVFCGSQFGHYNRVDLYTGDRMRIFPRHKLKEPPLRYNWMTPIVLSQHHHDVLYMGANKLLRSLDRGESWAPISGDLTTDPPQGGDVPFGTISMVRESPHELGTLYVGTDDGRIWLTRSNGNSWQEIGTAIANGLWVSGIEVSPHREGTVFVTLTGYRNDDFKAYVYRSDDHGEHWESLKGNLPDEPCNVIRQDPKNERLLFLGTDVGLFVSFDGGQSWQTYQSELPNVPVYAMEIHPREHELIVATHGRSVFVADLRVLSQVQPDLFERDLFVFEPESPKFDKARWGNKPWTWAYWDLEPPSVSLAFYTKAEIPAELTVSLNDAVVHLETQEAKPGIRRFEWDFQVDPQEKKPKKRKKKDQEEALPKFYRGENGKLYAVPGTYRVHIKAGEREEALDLEITGKAPGDY